MLIFAFIDNIPYVATMIPVIAGIGIPFTMSAVIPAYIVLWLLFSV